MFLVQRQINVIVLVKEQCVWNCRGCAIWLIDPEEKVFSPVGHETDKILLNFIHLLPLVYSGCFLFWFGSFPMCLLGVSFCFVWGFCYFVLFSSAAFLFILQNMSLYAAAVLCVSPCSLSKHKSVWYLLTLRQCLCPRAVQCVLGRLWVVNSEEYVQSDVISVFAIPFVLALISC